MTTQRIKNDYYPTPDKITKLLLDSVGQDYFQGEIFEPFAGTKSISKFFKGCITNDLYYPDHDYSLDASSDDLWEKVNPDWIITNPPYTKEILIPSLEKALLNSKTGVAFLLRLSILEPCQNRVNNILNRYKDNLRFVIPVSPRPQFRKDCKSRDSVTVAWFVWNKTFSWEENKIVSPFRFVRWS